MIWNSSNCSRNTRPECSCETEWPDEEPGPSQPLCLPTRGLAQAGSTATDPGFLCDSAKATALRPPHRKKPPKPTGRKPLCPPVREACPRRRLWDRPQERARCQVNARSSLLWLNQRDKAVRFSDSLLSLHLDRRICRWPPASAGEPLPVSTGHIPPTCANTVCWLGREGREQLASPKL